MRPHLCIFLLILAICNARPSWNKGSKNNSPLETDVSPKRPEEILETHESANANNQDEKQRYVRHHSSSHLGQSSNLQFQFNTQQGYQYPGQFQSGLYPIKQLAGTLDSIINSHLDATVELNKQIHYGLNGFRPPAIQPQFCQYPPCSSHTEFHQSSHVQFGQPQKIPIATQFQCQFGGANCREMPIQNNPPGRPFPEQPQDTQFVSKPSTTTERLVFGNEDSDIAFNGDEKGTKDEENPGIDIRFGN